MAVKIEPSWLSVLASEFEQNYMTSLRNFLQHEQRQFTTYPPNTQIFNAFNLTPFHDVKVVILGQDPYHGVGQAHGLSFSVPDGVDLPPSLRNIFQEISDDLGVSLPRSGNLERWAKQGVFLLNTTLTVRAHNPLSHQNQGWEQFTDAVIRKLSDQREHLVFMLWGSHAQSKEKWIDTSKHLILKTVHPSPLSSYRGFFGSKHFSKCNEYLQKNGTPPIIWGEN
ncbi:MAG: uracil-DNA glycosylase [Bacteroidales bacterium]|nr:uracil-DNA glycosylase [Bacteroidales bacterium]